MPDSSLPAALVTFVVGAGIAIAASALLARGIERTGSRLGVSEALLGLVAAFAADGPEITSSVSALHSGQQAVGVGVVLGSNVFNLAALLGVGALVAGRIVLHRRVIILEGCTALCMVAATLLLATGAAGAGVALGLALAGLVPYCAVISMRPAAIARLPLGRRLLAFLARAVHEEDLEIGPLPAPRAERPAIEAVTVLASLAAVIVASVLMEHAGVAIGERYHVRAIVIGGILLAAVTSLPNVVAAAYLARRGRGAAVLSEAMNSNALNLLVGLFIPELVIGAGSRPGSLGIAWWYAGLTGGALAVAGARKGFGRLFGLAIVCAYAGFVASVVLG